MATIYLNRGSHIQIGRQSLCILHLVRLCPGASFRCSPGRWSLECTQTFHKYQQNPWSRPQKEHINGIALEQWCNCARSAVHLGAIHVSPVAYSLIVHRMVASTDPSRSCKDGIRPPLRQLSNGRNILVNDQVGTGADPPIVAYPVLLSVISDVGVTLAHPQKHRA